MAIGTAAAIALAAGAASSAAGSAYSAHKQASAAKEAGKIQSSAAAQGRTTAREVYDQQSAMMSPYLNLGGSAAMTLQGLMGAPAGSRFAAGPAPNAPGVTAGWHPPMMPPGGSMQVMAGLPPPPGAPGAPPPPTPMGDPRRGQPPPPQAQGLMMPPPNGPQPMATPYGRPGALQIGDYIPGGYGRG